MVLQFNKKQSNYIAPKNIIKLVTFVGWLKNKWKSLHIRFFHYDTILDVTMLI